MSTYFTNFIHLLVEFNVKTTIADVGFVYLLLLNILCVQIPNSNTYIHTFIQLKFANALLTEHSPAMHYNKNMVKRREQSIAHHQIFSIITEDIPFHRDM